MILTGHEILREYAAGRITIDPFDPDHLNPNSYNFRLGTELHVYRQQPVDPARDNPVQVITIPEHGLVLRPHRL